jgi:hypothetical protein
MPNNGTLTLNEFVFSVKVAVVGLLLELQP